MVRFFLVKDYEILKQVENDKNYFFPPTQITISPFGGFLV